MPFRFRKVEFRLEPGADDPWIGAAESIWALPEGGDLYRLKNTPWCVCGVSYDDLVYAPIVNGRPTVERIVEHGGHFTLRARLADVAAVPRISAGLTELGCGVETDASNAGRTKLMTIDVPSESALGPVREYLDAELTAGRLDYEESAGSLAHAGRVQTILRHSSRTLQ
jgi:Domain of unknown function (DUF4265)